MVPFRLLEILYLLASLFDFRLHGKAQLCNAQAAGGDAAGLRQGGVGFTGHFLQHEVELLAHLAALLQQAAKLIDVGAESSQLLFDVAAFGQQRGFLQNAVATGYVPTLARERGLPGHAWRSGFPWRVAARPLRPVQSGIAPLLPRGELPWTKHRGVEGRSSNPAARLVSCVGCWRRERLQYRP